MKHIVQFVLTFLISCASAFSQETINTFSNLTFQKETYFGQQSPGINLIVFAPGIIIKPKQAHSNIVFSKEGNKAYWCHNGIWFSEIVDGQWATPEIVPFSKMEYSDDAPFLSPDGKKLYFTSKRPINASESNKKENIWMVELMENGWSEPQPLPSIVNDMFQHWQISVDLGNNLYFKHTESQEGKRNSDIYCSKFENGQFQKPIKLEKTINTEAQEINPFISPDGDFLIFTRLKDKKPLNGGLFISFKLADNTWSTPNDLQQNINFKNGGNCAIVTQDMKYLFLLDIYEGKWQRFWISAGFIDKLRPEEKN